MSLYFRKKPGLYAESGDWNNPAIWKDQFGFAVNRVPTAADAVYITGDVSGVGTAKTVTVGTLSQIGGPLFVKKSAGMYATSGDWNDPSIWYDEYGNQLNRVPTSSDDVFISGDVSGAGVARNVTVNGDVYLPVDKGQSENCCCAGPCTIGLPIANCYRVTVSAPECASSWFNGISVILRDPGSYCGTGPGGSGLNVARVFYPEEGQEIPDRSVLWGAPFAREGFNFSFYPSLEIFDYIDENTGAISRALNGVNIVVSSRAAYVLYQPANVGGGCGSSLHYPWVYSCTDVTQIDPYTEQEYTYQSCGFTRSDTPITVPPLHTVIDYADTETAFPGLNVFFVNRYSGCEEGCCNWPYDYGDFPGWEGCPNKDVCSEAYIVKFEIEAVDCPPKTYNCASGSYGGYYYGEGGGCVEVDGAGGEFETCHDCLTACVQRYTCDPMYGCTPIGFGTTGTTQSECATTCTPQSYVCDQWNGCQPRYDNSGTLQDCAACVERFTCDGANGCVSINYATSGYTAEECAENCVVQAYVCDPSSGCRPKYDNSGTLQDCAACVERFTCDGANGCVSAGYATSGQTAEECAANCVVQSYVCDQWNGCQPRYDNSGTLQDCAACVERFTCDGANGCVSINYATSGYTAEECATTCTPQSYVCDQWTGCQPRYDNSGTLQDCDTCLQRYVCYSNVYGDNNDSMCFSDGYGTTGHASLAACCAAGDCAGSSNCGGTMPMRMAISAITEEEEDATSRVIFATTELPAANNNVTTIKNTHAFNFAISTADMGRPAPPKKQIDPLIMNDPHGPGTFLSGMLEKIGIRSSPNCSCKARAYKMNEMGPDWCEENLDIVVGWLREEATKRKLPFVDFAGKLLVKRAIKLSRAAKTKAEQQPPDETNITPPDSDSQTGAG